MPLSSGTRLGPYEIVVQIGAGGMGEVYRAKDTRLGRDVAIKVLAEHLAHNPKAKDRFEREAKAVAALSHPNILSLYDIGIEGDLTFCVTEVLEGETLRSCLGGEALSLGRTIEISAAIAEGLAAAHGKGISHRDLKPENVFLTIDGQVKILDFGLARYWPRETQQDAVPTLTSTEPGTVMGTMGYMSPEQVRGEAAGPSSDIFSLGCVLHEMATGQRAFARATPGDILAAILRDQPPPVSNPELNAIVVRCLQKDATQRFQSARAVASALRSVKQNRRMANRRTALGWLGGTAAAVLASVFLYRMIDSKLRPGASIRSVAILPFVNESGGAEAEYLGDGITESLINSLSRLSGLQIMSRSAVFRDKARNVDPQVVGRALKVKAVLAGRVIQRGEDLVISAELVDVETNRHLWGDVFRRRMSDIQIIQDEISKNIADRLRLRLTGQEQKLLAKHQTEHQEAYRLYLQGRYFWNKRADGLAKAIEYFERAVAQDHSYALHMPDLPIRIVCWLSIKLYLPMKRCQKPGQPPSRPSRLMKICRKPMPR